MKRLLISLLWLCTALVAVHAKVYLVAVGINEYRSSPLNLCVNDAKVINYLYKLSADAETTLLLNSNATSFNIIKAMDKMYSKAKKNDIIIFYFSGHGTSVDSPNGAALVDYDMMRMSYDHVRNAMKKSAAKNKIIMVDACLSGSMRTGIYSGEEGTENYLNANVCLFLAARNKESGIEKATMKNGFFTAYLQQGLKGAADTNRDRTITAKELYNYVNPAVEKATGGLQHPVMWGKFSDDMPIIKWKKKKK
jgi:uncharacterized caspase-like protein